MGANHPQVVVTGAALFTGLTGLESKQRKRSQEEAALLSERSKAEGRSGLADMLTRPSLKQL